MPSATPVRLTLGILTMLGLTFAAGRARADEMQIRGRIAHLRSQPSSDARIKVKLGGGRSVAVIGQSEDGQWVHVKVDVEKGPDTIPFDGWLALAEIKGERMLGTEGGVAAPAADEPAPKESAADWDPAPAADKSSPPSPSSDSAWFDDPKSSGSTSSASSPSSASDDPFAAPASSSSSSSEEKKGGASDGW